jgi:hypothetical protein
MTFPPQTGLEVREDTLKSVGSASVGHWISLSG